LKQNEKAKKFVDEFPKLKQQRADVQADYNFWQQGKGPEVHSIMKFEISEAEQIVFNKLIDVLRYVKKAEIDGSYIEDSGLATCTEEAGQAGLALVKNMVETGKYSKLQEVTVSTKSALNPIADHRFHLLNSNLPDVVILDKPDKVKNHLKKINKKTKVCDSWNNYYAPLQSLNEEGDEANSLYNAEWESIEIKTIPVEGLKELSKINNDAARFFCREFASTGINTSKLDCSKEETSHIPEESIRQEKQKIF
jgi:hypothetical protein